MNLRLTSFGLVATMLLFVVPSYGQLFTREQLKSLEEEAFAIKSDTAAVSLYPFNATSNFALPAIKTFEIIDSLLVFVDLKMKDPTSSFETDIVPFIENKCKSGLPTFDFSEDEDQIFDSFLNVFQWDKAIETVELYEIFVLKNTNKKEKCEIFLSVLSFIKYLHCYIESKKAISNSPIYKCFTKNFESNNDVDWRIFALNPEKLILWTFAACAWESKSEK